MQYRENRLRNFLCALAVTVGVFSLVLLSNIGSFAAAQVTGMLDEIGLQGMTVFLKDSKNGEALSTAFAACMEEQVENVDSVTPVKFAGGTYQKGHRSGNVALIGAMESVWETLDLEFLYGQGFVDGHMVDVQNPIVISDRFARELFSRDNIVGKQFYITIDGHQDRYTVIGVVRDQLEMF
ncbi:MAG: ABC transporter permease, partial [Butyricicoccus sp.]